MSDQSGPADGETSLAVEGRTSEENRPQSAGSLTSEEKAPLPGGNSEENAALPAVGTKPDVKTPQPKGKPGKSAPVTPVPGISGPPTLSPDSPFWSPLKSGWIREVVYRSVMGPNGKRADAYYKSPVGKKYRSLKEIERAIDEGKPGFDGLTTLNFTYHQNPLGVNDPTMEVIRGADPSRQVNPPKRPSEAGEADSPSVKRPKKSPPQPKPPAAPRPKTMQVTAPPRIGPRPTLVARPPLMPYRQTAVRSPVRPFGQRTTVIGARGIRPTPNMMVNTVRTFQKVEANRMVNPSLGVPASPVKSAEQIVCEPSIYEGEDGQQAARNAEEDEAREGSSGAESNGVDGNGAIDEENCVENGTESVETDSLPNDADSQGNGADEDDFQAPSSEPDSTTQCLCGMCVVPVTEEKIICCAVVDSLMTVKEPHPCITMHPSFDILILGKEVLDMTRHLLVLKTKTDSKKRLLNSRKPPNVTWRYIAYKQFISWVNKCMKIGGQRKVAIPSCVVHAVRVRFPEPNGLYRVLRFT